MLLRLALIVPSIRDVGILTVTPHQACAGHPQTIEVGLGQIADVESEALRCAAVFDDKLQQDETFTGVAELSAGVEMNVKFLIRLDEPEVAESGGMRKTHARRKFSPAWIVGKILVGSIFVMKDRIGAITWQWLVEIVFDRCVQLELSLINKLHHRVGKHGLGERRTVHDCVRGQRIALGVTDTVSVDVTDLAMIDDGKGHTIGVGARHDLAYLAVDRRALGYGLCSTYDGNTGSCKKDGQKQEHIFPRNQGEKSFQNSTERDINYPRKHALVASLWLRTRSLGGSVNARFTAN